MCMELSPTTSRLLHSAHSVFQKLLLHGECYDSIIGRIQFLSTGAKKIGFFAMLNPLKGMKDFKLKGQ